jgi:signal transduction histidine kinase
MVHRHRSVVVARDVQCRSAPAHVASMTVGPREHYQQHGTPPESTDAAPAPVADAALLAAVLRQLPQGVILAEAPSGRLLTGNEQVARIWRHPLKSSGSIAEYAEWAGFHPDGRRYAPHEWPLARAISLGETVTDELIAILRGDGSHGVLQVSAAPVRDGAGRVVAGVVTFTDVTEQRRTADRMARLHFVTAALAEAVIATGRASFGATGACIALLQGEPVSGPDDAPAAASASTAPTTAPLSGTPETAKGPWLEVFRSAGYPQDVVDRWRRMSLDADLPLTEAARTRQPVFLPHRSETAAVFPQVAEVQERTGNHAIAVLPLLVEGRLLGVLGLSAPAPRDFDEEDQEFAQALALQCAQALDRARLYAAERAARERAEHALRARDEFLSAAAHELKTPLTSLQGAAQLALRRLEREDALPADIARQTLDLVAAQAKRLARLVVSLLDVTRLESGAIAVDRRTEDVIAIVRDAVTLMQPLAHEHTLSVTAPTHLPAQVDRVRLEQVVMSLVDNAIKYTPAGTNVTVHVERVPVSAPSQDREALSPSTETLSSGELLIAVVDDGPGVPPQHRERIFERYYRGDPATSLSGMGLGLYLCREIARAHGGELTASYPDAGGARFELRLPYSQRVA